MDCTTKGADNVRRTLTPARVFGATALTWSVASAAVADTLRWGGMIDPPQLDAAFVVFSIDTDLNQATIASLPWNLPATPLDHNTEFWTGNIGVQKISVMGAGEAGKPFTVEMMKIGPLGPGNGTLQWMPPLRDVEGVRAFAGFLDLPGMELDITIRLAQVDGALQAEIDIPLLLIDGMPVRVIASEGDRHTLVLDAPTPAELIVAEAPDGLTGTFTQASVKLDVDLRPTSPESTMKRPQMPKPPFPYAVNDIRVRHPEGHTLAGTLTIPEGDGPHPAVVLISGSGAQDRDETLFGHKPFWVLADHLSRNGIAVLRYDDRGVGESHPGNAVLSDDTSIDYASDVELLVDHLRIRDDIDPMRIGLMGHSEGGLIAPIVAAKRQDAVHFIVLLSGPGVPGRDVLLAQIEVLLLAAGEPKELVAEVTARQREVLEAVMADAPEAELRPLIKSLIEAQMALAPETKDVPVDDASVDGAVAMITCAWMRAFVEIDPADHLRLVQCPVLALNGTLDLQVPIDQNLPAIERVLRDAGGDVTVHRLEGLNHLFQPATKGTVDEYPRIETTFDGATMVLITDWIRTKTGLSQ